MTSATASHTVVLDTNITLDWLLFGDPNGTSVGQAITTGAWRWIATADMREEHFAVLGRPALRRWAPDVAAHRAVWDAHCQQVDRPLAASSAPWLRCSDPDDQMFVDLAVAARSDWLLSRDKALLALAVQLARYGVRVAAPASWAQMQAAAEATTF